MNKKQLYQQMDMELSKTLQLSPRNVRRIRHMMKDAGMDKELVIAQFAEKIEQNKKQIKQIIGCVNEYKQLIDFLMGNKTKEIDTIINSEIPNT